MGGLKVLGLGVSTHILLGVFAYLLDLFCRTSTGDQIQLYGAIGLVGLLLYIYIWTWTTVRTKSFYFLLVPLFLCTSYDAIVTAEIWQKPHHKILVSYVNAKDPHIHNVFVTVCTFFNGTIQALLSYTALIRISKGLSCRSLLIFLSASLSFMVIAFNYCALTSGLTLHPLIKGVMSGSVGVGLIFIGALVTKKRHVLAVHPKLGIRDKILASLSVLLLTATFIIFLAKVLVLHDLDGGILDIVRKNDPLIFLDDVEQTFPYASVLIYQYLAFGLPIINISILCHFTAHKPSFLWDLSVIQSALIICGQFFFIVGAFYWNTPSPLSTMVKPTNYIFWFLNVVPVLACLIHLASLLRLRVPAEISGVRTKKKKT